MFSKFPCAKSIFWSEDGTGGKLLQCPERKDLSLGENDCAKISIFLVHRYFGFMMMIEDIRTLSL